MNPLFATEETSTQEPSTAEHESLVIIEDDTIPPKISINEVKDLLARGEKTEVIADRLGLDLKVVQTITATIRRENTTCMQLAEKGSPRDVLTVQLANALDTIDLAREAYECKQTAGNATAIATLIETTRNLVRDLQEFKSSDAIIDQIDTLVIQPLVTDLIRHLSTEMNKARNDISKNVDPSKHTVVAEAVKQGLQGFGQHAKFSYEQYLNELRKIFGGR